MRLKRTLLLCALAVSATSALAQRDAGRVTSAREAYAQDRQYCLSGRSPQDQQTCLREAGAALQEAQRGTLLREGSEYEQNKFVRCDYHKDPKDREYCMMRMRGEGTITGSVEGGGLLRELRVIEPLQ